MELATEPMKEPTDEQKQHKEITDRYFQACAQLGDLEVKLTAIEEQKEKIHLEVHNLNQKYKKLAEKAQKTEKTDGNTSPTQTN